ncbi:MAG: hypothetical protein QOD24_2636 [Solirubrobacteraceae bacterium]|jgi:hypothetical protein|nr:hypothetical protein [Solirubrobacteraceae bacterium]
MEIQVAIIILLVALIIAALAVYLIATIIQLFKINAGLDVVLGKVGEIVAKSAPVNGVVDAINSNLAGGRDLLENLLLKKAGPDSAGLVESLFPGEGEKFLRRVGKSGKVVNTGTVYTRGVGILASLGRGAPIGAAHVKGPAVRDPQYSTTAASMLYPRPGGARARPKSPVVGSDSPRQYEAALTPGSRPRDAQGRTVEESEAAPPSSSGGGGQAQEAPPAPPPLAQRLSAKGNRPWETQARSAESEAAPPPSSPPPAAESQPPPSPPPADAPSTPGRVSAKGSRPWER